MCLVEHGNSSVLLVNYFKINWSIGETYIFWLYAKRENAIKFYFKYGGATEI